MTLQPFWDAPWPVQVHVYAVLPAFVLGTWLLFLSRKGTRPHRIVGRVYAALLLVTCATSLFIHVLNPHGWLGFSFVHLFILSTLFGLAAGIHAARRQRIAGHRRAMIATYISSLLIAGSFTLLPGRLMHVLLFGS